MYGSNTVSQMLTGKVYERVVRSHTLVSSALSTMLTFIALIVPIPCVSHTSSRDQEEVIPVEIEEERLTSRIECRIYSFLT